MIAAVESRPATETLAEAAPDLLDASRSALAWFDRWIELGGPVSGELRAVRLALMAAIAKAEAA